MDQSEFLHFDVTGKVIGALNRVYSKLGAGLPRDLYQSAVARELANNESEVALSHPVTVSYDDAVVSEWLADLLVDRRVIVVVTSETRMDPAAETRLLNVLKASEFEVGIIANFGDKLEF